MLHKIFPNKQFYKNKILYISVYRKEDTLSIMKEQELNTLMSVVSDPVENVYKLDSYKDISEIQRIIRIFNISEEQHNRHIMFSIESLATLRLVMSNN
jgi:hypothetical protein